MVERLNGEWEGASTRLTKGGPPQANVTVWSQCQLYFDIATGKVHGNGTNSHRIVTFFHHPTTVFS
jgi:hypothetical protein